MSTILEQYLNKELSPATTKRSVLDYCEFALAFDHERKQGRKYREALEITSEGMNVSVRTVRRAISTVKKTATK